MKKYFLFAVTVFVQVTFASNLPLSTVRCSTGDVPSGFTIDIISDKEDERILTVDFKNLNGDLLTQWNSPVNGVARPGFIKISQHRQSEDPQVIRAWTNIISDFGPADPNQSFGAEIAEYVDVANKPTQVISRYALTCSGQ